MQQTNFDLLKETVGKRFGQVFSDYGLPALSAGLFTNEQLSFLQEQTDDLPDDNSALESLLLQNVSKGKVLRTGQAPTGENLFTVRVPLIKSSCVLTLAYTTEKWSLQAIDAVQTRRTEIGKLLLGGLIGSAATALFALLINFGSGDDIVAQAKEEGYIVLTQQQYAEQTGQSQVSIATQDPSAIKEDTKSGDAKTGEKNATDQAKGKAITFHLQEGMTTWDLTGFLKEAGLIKDQMKFGEKLVSLGLDVQLRPQEYAFQSGMTEDEVIEALKK
ncbi:hypothetical protein CIG75_04655 [Tumebacillus algifaecis]|uniref:Uncharacterized protein n=1 Tax=Tumebacillus algifaecis TaxID=1214604 RepID=A0A223CYD8_9BACL|nr:hypothetical protein [Tumebacillus algifaecis]ASS74341.1 hypothetical protein CIG75_04655 [Tumebacillus algifaecis]